jgi:antitoxin (DNA-binding transcriptional repressor) of toxin-antitoxin stability system
MITVGILDLKDQLSHYLQYVKNGEKIIITEQNKVIAEINHPGDEQYTVTGERLLKTDKEGLIIPAKRNKSCADMPQINEELDWENIYNDVRSDNL